MKLLLALLCALTSAFPSRSLAQSVDQLLKSAQTAPDKKIQAKLYKQLGDKLVPKTKSSKLPMHFPKPWRPVGKVFRQPKESGWRFIFLGPTG